MEAMAHIEWMMIIYIELPHKHGHFPQQTGADSPRVGQIWNVNPGFAKESLSCLSWLVVWNMNFMFPYIGNNNPN
jgi:hypothetical protein